MTPEFGREPPPAPVRPAPRTPETPPPIRPASRPSEHAPSRPAQKPATVPTRTPESPFATGRSPARIAAIQSALDRSGFSPNWIDGRNGPRTRRALAAWLESRGRPGADALPPGWEAELLGAEPPELTHVVTDADHAGLAPVPPTWTGKAQVETLDHETVLERIAERFHSSEAWLRDRNPGAAWPNPPAGTALVVPNTVSPRRLPGADRIEIRLSERTLRAYDASGRVIALFPCSIAARAEKRPQGELRVVTAADRPNYTFDPDVFAGEPGAEGLHRKLLIPPGPNNPVGLAWISLNLPGYGIHGTPHPGDIGKTESHGCFRLANWNAQRLLRMVRPGTPVQVNP